MLIDFAAGGGLARPDVRYRADTDDLDEDLARELLDLVERSAIWNHEEPDVPQPAALDARRYDLRVRDGERARRARVDEASAPPPLRALLARLDELAGP